LPAANRSADSWPAAAARTVVASAGVGGRFSDLAIQSIDLIGRLVPSVSGNGCNVKEFWSRSKSPGKRFKPPRGIIHFTQ
jgi:hypothetical protein